MCYTYVIKIRKYGKTGGSTLPHYHFLTYFHKSIVMSKWKIGLKAHLKVHCGQVLTRHTKGKQNFLVFLFKICVLFCHLGGVVVSVLATGPNGCGFKTRPRRWIFKGDKNPQHTSLSDGK
jgi:hypothetical protein